MRQVSIRRCITGMAILFLVSPTPRALAAPAEASTGQGQPPTDERAAPDTKPPESPSPGKPAAIIRQEILVTAASPELAPTAAELTGRDLTDGPAMDLVETLRTVPGAGAVRRGPLNLDPWVRGLQETEILSTVDGTRTFAAGPGRMDSELSHVSPHAIERMRVIKGPYALTWGAGALGAVALDTLRSPFGGNGPRAAGRLGFRFQDNADATDAHAGAWGSGERWRYSVAAGQRQAGDYRAGGGEEIPGHYESRDARWSLGFQPTAGTVVELLGGYQEQHDIDYPGRNLDATYFYTRSHSLEITWSPGSGALDELSGQLYVNRKDHLMNNDAKPNAMPQPGRVPPFGLDVHLPTSSDTAGGRFRLAGSAGRLRWQAGGDVYRLDQTATRTISRRDLGTVLFTHPVWPDARVEDAGLYGQLEWRGPWTLVGTIRADRVEARAGTPSAFFLANTTGSLRRHEADWSAAASARRALAESWSLTLGAGRAVRTASVLERSSDRFPSTKFQTSAEFLGDPALRPEQATQLDLGVGYGTTTVQAEVGLFYRQVVDYITVAPDPSLPRRLPLSPPTVFRYVNGDATFYGGEAQLSSRPTPWFGWQASLSWIRGEDGTFEEPAFGMQPLSGRLGLRLAPRANWWVDLAATAVARQDRVARTRLERETPGYTVFDLGAGVSIGDRWRLRIGVENLADRRYATHLNSLDPFRGERILERGRSLYTGFELKF